MTRAVLRYRDLMVCLYSYLFPFLRTPQSSMRVLLNGVLDAWRTMGPCRLGTIAVDPANVAVLDESIGRDTVRLPPLIIPPTAPSEILGCWMGLNQYALMVPRIQAPHICSVLNLDQLPTFLPFLSLYTD